MKYSFDTSAIIETWRRKYPPDVFPPLWQKIEELIDSQEIGSSEAVFFDLEKQDDDILKWAKEKKHFFIPIDNQIQEEVKDILGRYPRLVEAGGKRSASDPFVIALAKMNGACVITYEPPRMNLNSPRIPDVCIQMNIGYKDMLGFIRDHGWVFNL